MKCKALAWDAIVEAVITTIYIVNVVQWFVANSYVILI